MDEPTFDALTRLLGRTQTRRAALRVLVGTGLAAFVAACTGQSPTPSPSRSPSPKPSPSPSPTLSPGDECPIPSKCGARAYCNAENTCICIKTAEGPVRCGQLPSSCNVPLCQTSADCVAAMGVPGSFCDTPNSGCCTDPPADLPRCLLPCGSGPAVTAVASPYATPAASWTTTAEDHRGHTGEQFSYVCPPGGTAGTIYGTDEYTDDSSVCTAAVQVGLITLASGGSVTIEMRTGRDSYAGSTRNGITSTAWGSWNSSFVFPDAVPPATAVPATVTCPSAGTCQECRLSPTNDKVTCAPCTTAGVAASMCGHANTYLGFGALAGRLIADGYQQVPPAGTESAQIYGGEGLERSVFVSYFALTSDPSQTAQLAYVETAWGEMNAFAGLLQNGKGSRVLSAAADGTIEEHPVQPQPTVTAMSVSAFALSASDPVTAFLFGCSDNCNITCGAVAGTIGAVAAALICAPTTVGVAVCGVLVFGLIAGGLFGGVCNEICNSVCAETPDRAFCPCNHGCFSSASDCESHCHSSLSCLNSCRHDPVCDTPLKQFAG